MNKPMIDVAVYHLNPKEKRVLRYQRGQAFLRVLGKMRDQWSRESQSQFVKGIIYGLNLAITAIHHICGNYRND